MEDRKGFSVLPDLKLQGPPLTVDGLLLVSEFSLLSPADALTRLVLLKKNRDVSSMLETEFVANANDHLPSKRLESVVVETGFA